MSARDFLRTPRGTLALIGATYVVAAAVSAGVAANRSFFERYVREKYAPVTTATAEVLQGLGAPDAVERVRSMAPAEKRKLYDGWMQSPAKWPEPSPRALMAADPAFFADAAFGTIVAGSPEQVREAVRFLALSGHAQAGEALDRALARAVRSRQSDLAAFVTRERQTWVERMGRSPEISVGGGDRGKERT